MCIKYPQVSRDWQEFGKLLMKGSTTIVCRYTVVEVSMYI